MNTPTEQAWSQPPDQIDSMAQLSNNDLDDLGNLFEFGDIDLNNIPPVDSAHFDEHLQRASTHPSTPFDELDEAQAIAGTSAQDFGAHGQFGISQSVDLSQQHAYNGPPSGTMPFTSEPMYQSSMQHFHPNQPYHFQSMHAYPSHQHVPPTPNSFDMHGESAHFMQQLMDPQQRAILEQRYQLRKEDAIAFTPMASPAGTPQFNVQPEFTIPGAYFSPLTSPMLHAQNSQSQHQQHQQGYYTNPSTAPSSNATSPLDPHADVDMLGDDLALSEPALAVQARKSSRRKVATPRSAGPLARVRQSPIQKAVKRKSSTMLSSLAPTREVEGAPELQRSSSSQPPSGRLQMSRSGSSENGSISPEPLSEALMGPPPRPGSSISGSPAIRGQQHETSAAPLGKAATPKSLLSMPGPQSGPGQNSGQTQSLGADDQMDLEDLQLPASVADNSKARPSLAQLDTRIRGEWVNTQRLSARKTPKLVAQSTPSSARPNSAMASPSIMGSPMTASTPGALLKDKRSDSKVGRGTKKRGSMSGSTSTLLSPALRPKISPSIKPLLPEGASLHSPTHALLLASKSNYQNLLEGNQLPGVNYPESLSTGLTSKRTSHKVAEQGRRNRINEALKEMQSLLPKSAKKEVSHSDGSPEAEPNSKESNEDAAVRSNNSKAATVESANDYIRKLQRENSAYLQLKREYEEMTRRLEELGGSTATTERSPSSGVPSASPAA